MRKGQKHSSETKKLLSEHAKKRVGVLAPNYGKSKDQEWRDKISKTLTGRKLPEDVKNKIAESSSRVQGGRNPLVRTAYYHRAHKWVYKTKGRPSRCEQCLTTTAKKFEWANLSQEYGMVESDWKRMCTSCHRKYDIRFKTSGK